MIDIKTPIGKKMTMKSLFFCILVVLCSCVPMRQTRFSYSYHKIGDAMCGCATLWAVELSRQINATDVIGASKIDGVKNPSIGKVNSHQIFFETQKGDEATVTKVIDFLKQN